MQTLTLNIKGMTCMGCVKSVKNVLEAVDGVSNVIVTLDRGQVEVTFDPAKASAEQFRSAIADAGYEVIG